MNALVLLVLAAGPVFGPFGSRSSPVTHDTTVPAPAAHRTADARDDFFEVAYEFYRLGVSPIDGPRCAHRPTCSRYGLLAVRRHGAIGLWLTIDRLMRDDQSSPLRRLRVFEDGGALHLLDPLEESTFWFSRSH